MGRLAALTFIAFFWTFILHAQIASVPSEETSISISGVVFSADSILALPYVSIYVNQLTKGTISDETGYFDLIAHPNDTIVFSAVGYKTAQFILPDHLVGKQYSVVQGMVRDTIILEEITVYSLPTTSEFMESFSDTSQGFEERISEMQDELTVILEEDIILGKYAAYDVNNGVTRLYNAQWGLVPPNNFLNPLRWSQFIQDLRRQKSTSNLK